MAQTAPNPALPELPIGQFSRLYAALTGTRVPVAERAAPAAQLREKVVRCLWFDQFLDPETLQTEDGRRLTVFSPGYWNEGSGPDFRNAEFAFDDGPRQRGDVELHVVASDWDRHGHRDDPAYEKVLLHVVLHNDLDAPVIAHAAHDIPQLALDRHLSADLEEILQSLDPDGYPRVGCGREGQCCRSLRASGRDDAWIGRFLDIAGDERMLRKAAHFGRLAARATPDDALYEALMETMGYSANRRGFRLLAQAAPLGLLRRFVPVDAGFRARVTAVQAVLFGAAGFLQEERPGADDEARAYRAELLAAWSALGSAAPAPMERSAWSLHRTRPTNHPIRRIAGISAFLAERLHGGLCRAMMGAVERIPLNGPELGRCRRTLESFLQLIESEPQPFWERRTGFVAPCLSRQTALIGAARATEMVVNVVVPLLLSLARDGDASRAEYRLHNLYASLRPLGDNSITDYMKSRVFDAPERADRVVRSIRRQQGLLQLFHDYCESGSGTCDACGFLAAIEGWGR